MSYSPMSTDNDSDYDNDYEDLISRMSVGSINNKDIYGDLLFYLKNIQKMLHNANEFLYEDTKFFINLKKFLQRSLGIYKSIGPTSPREEVRIKYAVDNINAILYYIKLYSYDDLVYIYDVLVNMYLHIREVCLLDVSTRKFVPIPYNLNDKDISMEMAIKEDLNFI
jgi:hypothetical protein